MVDADHHNNLNIKGSPAKRFFVNDYKSIFFWVEQTMECGIATLLSKLVGGNSLPFQNRVSKSFGAIPRATSFSAI